MAVSDQLKKNRKKTKTKRQKSDSKNEPQRVGKPEEKELHEQAVYSASKKNKRVKKQKSATVDNDAETSKLNGEEFLEEGGDLVLRKNKKSKKCKVAPLDNDMGVDKPKEKELHEQAAYLASKKNKKVKQKTATVDDDAETSKLNGEEFLEEGGDLVSRKKKKSKKQKAAPVDNGIGERNDNTMNGFLTLGKLLRDNTANSLKMEKLEAEKMHEGEKSSSSKKKMKIKKKKSTPVHDDAGEKNTKGAPLKGMKKWLLDYHGKRPGLHVLMREIDEFIMDHEDRVEKERKEREAAAAAEGWTVVVHQKGRKKTVDAESGIAVGSVAEAAAKAKSAKKKSKETDVAFYRFQMREARRNEILELQKKFDEDRKRIVQMRAARKFRPY
ncbi:hypothetical protein SUGI_0642910 [Cryptomeria japonica]|uniref:uncharacterized protein LOC131067996 isoform X1 n=1 Tax=Cryptomeria japonica TaxID=3369 RepID=UPI002414A68D|nr:uncharacterized protein LOC131067996 isoform X1 [Cryptomeria japonica]XP_057859163.1 uncharacterized protein LOC131067996 isoform X1 [Cryptomeria japonica]GLJ31939.1 hypothetical protein SUGI_0642910 [Cryptomeria japonica]